MKLREFFLTEGANDAEQREQVDFILEVFEQNLNKAPDRVFAHSKTGDVYAVYICSNMNIPPELDEIMRKLVLIFRATIAQTPGSDTRTSAMYGYSSKFEHITLLFDVPSKRTPEQWSSTVQKNAVNWVRTKRGSLFHEVIHLLDAHRYEDPTHMERAAAEKGGWDKDDPETLSKYFNQPHETNAYFQQFFDEMETQFVKEFPTFEAAMDGIGASSPRDFVMFLRNRADGKMQKYLTQDNARRFDKRAYQLYQDLKHRFSG